MCAGTYTYTVTDANGCTATTTANITQPAPLSANTSASPSAICTGNCATITMSSVTGGTPPYTYLWLPGGFTTSSVSVCPTANTTYTCTVTDANNCSFSGTASVTVNSLPTVTLNLASIDTQCVTVSTVPLSGGNPSGGTYSGTAVSGGNFSPSTAGTGTFTITYTYTDGNGCTGNAAANIYVDACTGLSTVASAQEEIIIYPNPTSGQVTLSLSKGEAGAIAEVYNIYGAKIFSSPIGGGREGALDLSDVPNGIYFLQLKTETEIITRKIIKE